MEWCSSLIFHILFLIVLLSLTIGVLRVDNFLILLTFKFNEIHLLKPTTIMAYTYNSNLYLIINVFISDPFWIFQYNCINFKDGFVFLVV